MAIIIYQKFVTFCAIVVFLSASCCQIHLDVARYAFTVFDSNLLETNTALT